MGRLQLLAFVAALGVLASTSAALTKADRLKDGLLANALLSKPDEWIDYLISPFGLVEGLIHSDMNAKNAFALAERAAAHVKQVGRSAKPFKFIPQTVGQLKPGQSLDASGAVGCWKNVTLAYSMSSADAADAGRVEVHLGDKTTLMCGDVVVLATRSRVRVLVLDEFISKKAYKSLGKWVSDAERQDVRMSGFRVFYLQDGVVDSLASLFETLSLFIGPGMASRNAEFISSEMQIPMRKFDRSPTIPPAESVHSGDYLAIARFDGLDPLVMFGTGGSTGHTAAILRVNGTAYVVESTDVDPFGKAYWPPPYGIIITEYNRWMELAQKAQYSVVYLPLNEKRRSMFNEAKAVDWFFGKMKGLPYGYHIFLYSFVDTLKNWPVPVSAELVEIALNAWDRLTHSAEGKVSVYSLIIEGLNKRLGNKAACKTMACIANELVATKASEQPYMSLAELMAQPEQDEWQYPDGYSRMCSAFVMDLLKNAGVFADIDGEINASEHTPKDSYQIQMFDTDSQVPSSCKVCASGTCYCQLFGAYELPLYGVNSIPPYKHMNERCACRFPTYARSPSQC